MLHITSLDEGLEIFKALGSDVRINILNILMEKRWFLSGYLEMWNGECRFRIVKN